MAGIYRALAEHERTRAYPDAVAMPAPVHRTPLCRGRLARSARPADLGERGEGEEQDRADDHQVGR
jgi:hypothetical protein